MKVSATEQAVILQALSGKEVLTFAEGSIYLGLSKSYLYKLTSSREIPFFKPHGKLIFFNRQELENWAQSNRVITSAEASREARGYCKRGGVL